MFQLCRTCARHSSSYAPFNAADLQNITAKLNTLAQSRRRLMRAEKVRRAAVLVPLCNVKGVPSILFTLRTEKVGTHKGQVSFPGGHREENETGSATAVRETVEELGFDASFITPLGYFHDVLANEVASVFTLPLDTLTNPANKLREQLPFPADAYKGRLKVMQKESSGDSSSMPAFTGGPAKVWGLTAFILDQVLDEVLIPTLRTR